jgi:hypothetical protein
VRETHEQTEPAPDIADYAPVYPDLGPRDSLEKETHGSEKADSRKQ